MYDKPTYQLNPLIEAQKDFDVMETRLFYLGLQDVNPHLSVNDKYYDKFFPDTIITPAELTKIFGHSQYLTEIDRATDKLIGRYIAIKMDGGFDKYTIFQHIRYKPGMGLFIKFNEDMRPFILEIYDNYKKYGFTKIEMQQIFNLRSTYAMRLLELLLQYRGKAKNNVIEREISIEDLRYKLNVPDNAYKVMSNFRSRVLDFPINDINKNTKYCVSYKTIKKGRSVVAFEFTCNCNNVRADSEYTDTIDAVEKKEIEAPAAPPVSEEKAKTITKLVNYGFSLSTIDNLLDTCGGWDELSKRLEYGEKRAKIDREKGKQIQSISGYLRMAIEENWLQAKLNEDRAKERELEAAKTNAEWELWALKNFANEPVPDVPEKRFNEDNEMGKIIISMIRSDIKARSLSSTTERLLRENGLTVSRFIELYM